MRRIYLLMLCMITFSCNKENNLQKISVNNIGLKVRTAAVTDPYAAIKTLKINGAICPFDKDNKIFYFPASSVNPATNYRVNFDSTQIKSFFVDKQPVHSNQHLSITLTVNEQAQLQFIDNANTVYNCTLVVTGLPIVNVHEDSLTSDGQSAFASFELIDADYQAHNGVFLVNSNSSIKLHGSSSIYYPKHSVQVSTADTSNNDLNVSLLGLRSDQNWILDAMYVDQSRMRNRLCTDIWNSFNNVPYIASQPSAFNGTRGYLVEAVFNDEYQGVYCLSEKLDRKQIQANKTTGMMYKSDYPGDQTAFLGIIPYDNTSDDWGGWEFTYPDIGDSPAPSWSYLSDFTNFVATSTDSAFVAGIGTRVNLDNVVDYLIAINTFAADDNVAKNQYFSFYSSKSNPQFFYSVWDLDGSFGRDFSGAYYQNPGFAALGSINNLFSRLIKLDPSGFRDKIKTRWNILKTNQLSKAAVNARILNFAKQLISTNAGTREIAKWGNITQGFDVEATYMSNWYSHHYDQLDSYINNNL